MNPINYYNFPRETERRVHRWHLAAIPTTAKDMVGVNPPVHLRDAMIGGECTANTMSGLSHLKIDSNNTRVGPEHGSW